MARQIEGVYEAVLRCAEEEFLAKGYKDASLRTIAERAGTSTGSIYTRFGDKEGLFSALVAPVAGALKEMFLEIQERFHNFDASVQEQEMGNYTQTQQMAMLDYIYDHFEIFQILLEGAEGRYAGAFKDGITRCQNHCACR